jgi:hypothetical protein
MTMVTGLFRDWNSAAHAIDLLSTSGFSSDSIGMVAREDIAKRYRTDASNGEVTGGSTTPAPAVGMPPAGFAGQGASTANGVGLGGVFIAGPLFGVGQAPVREASAGHEAMSNTDRNQQFDLQSSLVAAGVPDERAAAYAEGIQRGEVLVAVRTEANAAQAGNLLNQANAAQVSGM